MHKLQLQSAEKVAIHCYPEKSEIPLCLPQETHPLNQDIGEVFRFPADMSEVPHIR
jgi:hypothetical protein